MFKSEFLTPVNVLMILGTIVLLSLGQVLFKSASTQLVVQQPTSWLSLPLLGALVIYAIATLLWLLVLTRWPACGKAAAWSVSSGRRKTRT